MVDSDTGMSAPKRSQAGLLSGLILVGLGIIFLLGQYGILYWEYLWPWILIVIGGALVITHFTGRL